MKDELSRLRKQGTKDDSGELERNKALLMKARHAIGKLQVTPCVLISRLCCPSIDPSQLLISLVHLVSGSLVQAERDKLVAQLRSSSDGISTADTIALKSRLERSDDRVSELESALGEANAMIDSLRRSMPRVGNPDSVAVLPAVPLGI